MAARPLLVDVVLAGGLTVVSVIQGVEDDSADWKPYDRTGVLLTVLATLPVAARRRAPVAVLLFCCGGWALQIAAGYNPIITTYGVLLALYTVAATQPGRRIVACFVVAFTMWAWASLVAQATSALSVALQGLVIPAVIWKLGDSAKRLDESNRRLVEANTQLRRDREEQARRAVTDERVRIARELHDVVAHHVSVIAVQTGLARYVLRSDPATAHAALGTVLDTSAEAMEEMRRLLKLLRVGAEPANGGPESDAPAPGLATLPELFNRMRAAGVPVEVHVRGTPQALSPGLELCAYRVIQEALTNVLKHAAPAAATVVLEYHRRRLVAVVRDDGTRTAQPGGTGQGLIGMRERAMLYGGTLQAAARPGGGFEVRLELPVTAAAQRDDEDRT
ncbi:sensor histidine kinase [Actinoplanes sp. NBC_00393]|uniref:sensor histidine kinase n=1 Tax=Actinoplanes sp. NBC_00393 TaxID=2975953 RepID=UPI002E1CBDEE